MAGEENEEKLREKEEMTGWRKENSNSEEKTSGWREERES